MGGIAERAERAATTIMKATGIMNGTIMVGGEDTAAAVMVVIMGVGIPDAVHQMRQDEESLFPHARRPLFAPEVHMLEHEDSEMMRPLHLCGTPISSDPIAQRE